MNDKVQLALYQYMLSHIRLNTRSQLTDLSYLDVAGMFSTLAPPAIDFAGWCVATNVDVEDEEAKNEAFIAQMDASENTNITVGPPKPGETEPK